METRPVSDPAKRRLFALVFVISLIVTAAFVNDWFAASR
jgi:hypothetical protein